LDIGLRGPVEIILRVARALGTPELADLDLGFGGQCALGSVRHTEE